MSKKQAPKKITKPNDTTSKPRLLAFYLPQYHPIAENDEWWGKGFTEWSNVTKAKPLFPGHYQPHQPSDLGYYDLRLPEVREAQADLAREYGIYGFCYYHYWFGGKQLLNRPFQEVLESGKPDLPFCLCWANENWTRRWDGLDKEVLIGQAYSDDDDLAHIRYLATAFADERYIRVNGKPLFLVYRVKDLPDPAKTARIWREEARKLGIGEIYLCKVQSFFDQSDPSELGFDAAVEFEPDGADLGRPLALPSEAFETNNVFNYVDLVKSALDKPTPAYKEFPCVIPSWDNSARRKENAQIIKGSSPALYKAWLQTTIEQVKNVPSDENFIFVNAWNEWGEGNHLEPDQKFGRGYLEATKQALEGEGSNLAEGSISQLALLEISAADQTAFVASLREQFLELSADRNQKLILIQKLEAQIQAVEDDRQIYIEQAHYNAEHAKNLESEIAKFKEHITQVEQTRQTALDQVHNFGEQMDLWREHIANIEQTRQTALDQVHNYEEQMDLWRGHIANIEKDRERVLTERDNVLTEREHLLKHQKNLERELLKMSQAHRETSERLAKAEQRLEDRYFGQQQTIDQLAADRVVMLAYVAKLEQARQALLEQYQQLEQQFHALQLTRTVRTSRSLGLAAHHLQQSLSLTGNIVAGPLFRSLKGAIEGAIDTPQLDFVAKDILELKGWAVSSSLITKVEVFLGSEALGEAQYGLARADVLALRPWQSQIACGYAGNFLLHSPASEAVTKELMVRATDQKGHQRDFYQTLTILPSTLMIETALPDVVDVLVKPEPSQEDIYLTWIVNSEPSSKRLEAQRGKFFSYRPLMSIVTPVYNPPVEILRLTLDSVLAQTYAHWEWCIADGSTDTAIKELLSEYAAKDSRIKVEFLEENSGIVGNSNQALAMVTGEFVALLDHDDELAQEALYQNVAWLNKYPDADMIYSDEDKLGTDGRRTWPFFKPDWSPDLFHSVMYTCHLGVYRASLLKELGGFRAGLEGAQDYDLVLRLTEKTKKIYHIPKILYHWRMSANSTAGDSDNKDYARNAQIQALSEHFERLGKPCEVTTGMFPDSMRVRYHFDRKPRVSIVIPTRDHADVLKRCIDSILELSTYHEYDIIIVDNDSVEAQTHEYFEELKGRPNIRVLPYPGEFNFSAINNFAVSQVHTELVLLLNNDVEIISAGWLEAMIEHALRPEVGAVGARLLYPNDTLQHGGVIVGLGGVAGHSHKYFPTTDPGYYGRTMLIQNFSAVTAACLMTRTEVYRAVGGLDEKNMKVAFNDVDFCLRIREKGWLIVWTPFAELYHHESLSRGADTAPDKIARFQREVAFMRWRWANVIEHDPYYNPNLTRDYENFTVAPVSRFVNND